MADVVVRRGYLSLHRSRGSKFPLSSLSFKRVWMMLCREGPSGRARIEMYRSEESVSGNQPLRMVDMETVRSVQPVEKKKGFLVELLDETMMLQCTSKADMEDWVWDMNRLRGGGVDQNIGGYPAGHDIYEEVPDDETFRVNLRATDSITFSGSCYLEIQRDLNRNLFHIALLTKDEPSRLIVKWQIDHIRQYGSNHSAFKFQSGGKSTTGVGWFIVDTESGAAQRIHRAVDYWAKYIVDQIKSAKVSHRPAVQHSNSVPVQEPSLPHPSLSSSAGVGAYAPLTMVTRDKPSLYQEVAVSASTGRQHQLLAQATRHTPDFTSSASSGVYQALGQKDDPSAYAAVTPTHQAKGGGTANRGNHTPNSSRREATYMGLRMETLQSDNSATYCVPQRN